MDSSTSELRKAHAILPDSIDDEHWQNKHVIAIDQVPDALLLVGRGGIIFQVNDAARLMFDYDDQELAERPIEIPVPERLMATHKGHVSQHEKAAK